MVVGRCVLLMLTSLLCAHAYPEGAPPEACETMVPQHLVQPQTSEPPYGLSHVANDDGTYQVTLQRIEDNSFLDYRGFLIQARSEATGTQALGVFTFENTDLIQSRPCPEGGTDNGVTHVSSVDLKNVIDVTWSPGENGDVEGVYFVATVVLNFPTFWVDIRSPTL